MEPGRQRADGRRGGAFPSQEVGTRCACPESGRRVLAGDEPRTACDGQSGKQQLACITENYPKIAAKVEDLCAADEQPRQCRQREFATRGIQFTPGNATAETSAKGGAKASKSGASGPTYVTVRFVGAQIGPGMSDGSNWDGPNRIPPAALEGMLALASGGTTLAAGGEAGKMASDTLGMATQGTAAPEVIGWVAVVGPTNPNLAKVAGTPMALGTSAQTVQDSYTPTFAYQMEYRNWPVFPDTRFELQLWDADMQANDPIGVLQLNAEHIAAALAKKSIYEIPVADQTSGQVLTIKISATPGAGASAASEMKGYAY